MKLSSELLTILSGAGDECSDVRNESIEIFSVDKLLTSMLPPAVSSHPPSMAFLAPARIEKSDSSRLVVLVLVVPFFGSILMFHLGASLAVVDAGGCKVVDWSTGVMNTLVGRLAAKMADFSGLCSHHLFAFSEMGVFRAWSHRIGHPLRTLEDFLMSGYIRIVTPAGITPLPKKRPAYVFIIPGHSGDLWGVSEALIG